MSYLFFSILFLFGTPVFSKAPTDKTLQCTEKGCNCTGKDCAFVDPRIIKSASTVAITCSAKKKCDKKIVYSLKDKYGCKASVQKIHEQDYMVVSECMILDSSNSDICPTGTTSEVIEELIKICLEVPERNIEKLKK